MSNGNKTLATANDSIMTQGDFEFYVVSEHGIEFKKDCTREAWLEALEKLSGMYESSGRLHFRSICMLGDAFNFGERTFGEEYAQAIDSARKYMRLNMKTVQNAAWICASIEPSRRREALSLSHHEAVAALDDAEQDELLALAENEGLSVSALKKVVSERHPKTAKGKKRATKMDLKSESGLQAAADKIVEFFAEYDAIEDAVALKDWPEGRKNKWSSLTAIAKIARRMGLSR